MNILKKLYYRTYQFTFKQAVRVISYKKQRIIKGERSIEELPKVVKEFGVKKVLIVSGKIITKLGLANSLMEGLKSEGIEFVLFNDVEANPSVNSIELGLKVYEENNCNGIIAFGGGSPMDCAKIIGVRATNKNISIRNMKGMLKIKKGLPPFFAVPTTAGTASESTIAAVVTDSNTHEKYAIADPKLMPDVAVLDANVTVGLPKNVTSTTGMDALTHAMEAYLGIGGNSYTDKYALKAIKLIFENLEEAYNNGKNIEARENMLIASNYAGVAFTRANVGYVHAIAHSLGGLYGVPHGLANAVVLPYVLDFYGESIYKKLANIAQYVGMDCSDNEEIIAKSVIKRIRQMNIDMEIPDKIENIEEKHIDILVNRSIKEANPAYPVPKIMNNKECENLIKSIMKKRVI